MFHAMADAVRGLSLASTSQADASTSHPCTFRASRRFASSGRSLHITTKPVSRSSRLVVFAVLVDKQVESKPKFDAVESLRLELADAKVSKVGIAKSKPELGLTDTNLKSTLEHRLWVAFGATAVTATLAKAVAACQSSEDAVQVGAGVLAAVVLSDLATGFYHWGIDNYGDATTPIFGSQIDAFQGHHQRPWTITKRQFANNIHALARPAGSFLLPFLLVPAQPFAHSFLAVFLGMVVMSQQLHALAHKKKSQLPRLVLALQDAGLIIGRKMHGTHHRPPYDVNYCIISGLWNPWLNQTQIFKRMERSIYRKWGVAPRAWSETSEEWLQADSYFEDGTDFDPLQSP